MIKFEILVDSYELMPAFTKLLCNNGINFNNNAENGLFINVEERDLERFLELAVKNNIRLKQA
ncbi:Uncharacterised protein [Clostridium baratii]|uniref:hypothetical protein n=1 Tax=Clostridium baratii TaxID=1561 RepID=UPI0006BF65B2|nr:hypothetical protein [Clostridium baratii]CUP06244.1 Uncharacterised protein [Clostridium baratii]